MSEEEIRKFCEDFAFSFTSKLSLDKDFDSINGYTLERVYKDLADELELYVKRMITFNHLEKNKGGMIMKDEIIICDCSSAEHQIVLRFDEDKDLGRQVFVEIHLVPLVWYKRLWHGIKYIFGYKCCYGNFEQIILSPEHARQVYGLYRFLNRPNLKKGGQQ